MMQQPESDDYVIGTGISHSVREFLETAFRHAGIENWQDYVEIDPRYFRPAEVEHLMANATKAREKLGWAPKTTFAELVKIMVDEDLKPIQRNAMISFADLASPQQRTSQNGYDEKL